MIFSTFGFNFYEEIAGLKPAKVFALVCYTYGWSYGCCLVVQDMSGDIWAVEEVTETKKSVQFIQYRWRDAELLLVFLWGTHSSYCSWILLKGFCCPWMFLSGTIWLFQKWCSSADSYSPHNYCHWWAVLYVTPTKVMCLLSPLFPLPGILENPPQVCSLPSSL